MPTANLPFDVESTARKSLLSGFDLAVYERDIPARVLLPIRGGDCEPCWHGAMDISGSRVASNAGAIEHITAANGTFLCRSLFLSDLEPRVTTFGERGAYNKYVTTFGELIAYENVAFTTPIADTAERDLISRIKAFADLKAGWDGERALKLAAAAVQDAIVFVRMAGALGANVSPCPHVDGSMLLEIDDGCGGAIEFHGDSHFVVAVDSLPLSRERLTGEVVRRVVSSLPA